jgi:hypothetical protein
MPCTCGVCQECNWALFHDDVYDEETASIEFLFSERERKVIADLSVSLNVSHRSVIRRALRVYQLVAENEEVLRSLVPNNSPGCGVVE